MAIRRRRRNHGYENQAASLAHDFLGRGTVRKNSTVPIGDTNRVRAMPVKLWGKGSSTVGKRVAGNPMRSRSGTDIDAAHELALYIDTSSEPLYRMSQQVRKNLMAKRARGTYDLELSKKAWKYVADAGAREYTREYGTPGPHGSFGVFGPAERQLVASMLANDFYANARTGEYDALLPKKYQPKKNMAHFPRTTRGPKGKAAWFILDLYDGSGRKVSSRYKRGARAKMATEAAGLVNRKVQKHIVRKVELSGPYSRKPNASTPRK